MKNYLIASIIFLTSPHVLAHRCDNSPATDRAISLNPLWYTEDLSYQFWIRSINGNFSGTILDTRGRNWFYFEAKTSNKYIEICRKEIEVYQYQVISNGSIKPTAPLADFVTLTPVENFPYKEIQISSNVSGFIMSLINSEGFISLAPH